MAFSSPVLTTPMLMDTNRQIAFRTSRHGYILSSHQHTRCWTPSIFSSPSLSSRSAPLPSYASMHQILAYCYNRCSRVKRVPLEHFSMYKLYHRLLVGSVPPPTRSTSPRRAAERGDSRKYVETNQGAK